MDYIAYLHKDKNSDFGVSFPDFPGCVTAGKTLEEAQAMAREALEFHIEGMIEDGEEVPAPSVLDDVSAELKKSEGIAILVPLTMNTKTLRVNISTRADRLAEIDSFAEKAGMDRSSYMVWASISAGKDMLTVDERSERRAARRHAREAGEGVRHSKSSDKPPAGSQHVKRHISK